MALGPLTQKNTQDSERRGQERRGRGQGDYGSAQGDVNNRQSQRRGRAGMGGHSRKPAGGQGQYDSEQGTSNSQQHAPGHYASEEQEGSAGFVGRSHWDEHGDRHGREKVVRDTRFDGGDPDSTDITSRAHVDSIGWYRQIDRHV